MKSFPEKIVGAGLILDIAKLARDNNLSVYLLGGYADTPKIVAEKLNATLYSNKNPGDASVIEDINESNPDILLVAYGPIKQEKWIYENLPKLTSVKLVIGVGGSFDYIAGKRLSPPKWMRKIGLEWLWRLITQPQRIKRIWQATFSLIYNVIKYKVRLKKQALNDIIG